MEGKKAKELAAKILKVGVGRVRIKPEEMTKVKEAMTKDDIRALIAERVIKKRPSKEQSRGRARILAEKKSRGRKKGKGKRFAKKKRRSQQRKKWVSMVRAQRRVLKELKQKDPQIFNQISYSDVYKKIKGNYFRGKRHLVEYLEGARK